MDSIQNLPQSLLLDDSSFKNIKRPFSEISGNEQNIEPNEEIRILRMKDKNGKAHNIDLKLSDNEIIVERSENSSTDKKASSNLNANVNNVKMSNSCILSNKFVSMKSKIENFFTKRSCEHKEKSLDKNSKKDLKLTKPTSPNLLTKSRVRKDCDCILQEESEKKKISIRKPTFVFKKYEPDSIVSNENCFQNGKFKARKVPSYKIVEIKKSEKDCVVPIGFKLKTKQRTNKNQEKSRADSFYESKSLEKVTMEKRLDLSNGQKTYHTRYSLLMETTNNRFGSNI